MRSTSRISWTHTTITSVVHNNGSSINVDNPIKEDARSGYVVTDIYTIPANRLISKNLSNRTATVTIVQGTSTSQTIVVFVNRAVSSQAAPDGTTVAYVPNTSPNDAALLWQGLWEVVLGRERESALLQQ